MYMILTNVNLANALVNITSGQTSATVAIKQSVRIGYVELDTGVIQQNSGNPGYLVGFPLLVRGVRSVILQGGHKCDPACGHKCDFN
jgi:hypothetical protein